MMTTYERKDSEMVENYGPRQHRLPETYRNSGKYLDLINSRREKTLQRRLKRRRRGGGADIEMEITNENTHKEQQQQEAPPAPRPGLGPGMKMPNSRVNQGCGLMHPVIRFQKSNVITQPDNADGDMKKTSENRSLNHMMGNYYPVNEECHLIHPISYFPKPNGDYKLNSSKYLDMMRLRREKYLSLQPGAGAVGGDNAGSDMKKRNENIKIWNFAVNEGCQLNDHVAYFPKFHGELESNSSKYSDLLKLLHKKDLRKRGAGAVVGDSEMKNLNHKEPIAQNSKMANFAANEGCHLGCPAAYFPKKSGESNSLKRKQREGVAIVDYVDAKRIMFTASDPSVVGD